MDENIYKYENFFNILIIPHKKILIDWKEKSGCTTIVKMIFQYLGILDDALKYDKWVHKYRMDVYYNNFGRVNSNNIENGKFKDYYKIKFVRNPYSRAISSYLHVMNNLDTFEKFKFGDISFHDFLCKIKDIKNPNVHWQKQSRRIEKFKKDFFFKIIKIENIDNEILVLNKKFELNLIYDKNSNHHVKKSDNIDFVGYTKYSLIKNRIPKYIYFYNNKIRDLVTKIYSEDLKIYNYTFSEFTKNIFS